MNLLAERLTHYIIKKNAVSEKDYEAYKYGMLTGMEILLFVAISSVIALYLKSFLEFAISIGVFCLLRSYVGGMHFKSYAVCLVCSCFVISLVLILAKYLMVGRPMLLLGTGVTLLLIEKLDPVVTQQSSDDKEEQRYFEKQRHKILLGIMGINIFFIILQPHFAAAIFYTMLAIWISMILGIAKNAWMGKNL